MKYELVVRDGFESMNEAVNEMIQDGWGLQGGVSIANRSTTFYYCQAMVKYDEVTMNVRVPKTSIGTKINPRMEDYIK